MKLNEKPVRVEVEEFADYLIENCSEAFEQQDRVGVVDALQRYFDTRQSIIERLIGMGLSAESIQKTYERYIWHINKHENLLKKDTPTEVEMGTEGGLDWYCKCGNYLSRKKEKDINYCPKCGQKLDWS